MDVYSEYEKYFNEDQNISRRKLAKKCNISEQKARSICAYFKEKRKNNGIIKRGIAVGDLHSPYEDKKCFKILLEFIKDFNPDYFILGGDQNDFGMISTFDRKKVGNIESKRVNEDYIYCQENILNPIESLLKPECEKVWIIGNHDARVNRLIEVDPQFEGYIEVENNLDLDDWIVIPENKAYSVGHLNFIHGNTCVQWHAKKNLDTYAKHVVNFHVHTNQIFTKVTPLDELPQQGVSVGCMCHLNPKYMKNKESAWLNQFFYFYMFSDGSFVQNIVTILNGRTIINNKLYEGK